MKFLDYLQEDWVAMSKCGKFAFEIYKNPTAYDLEELHKSIIKQLGPTNHIPVRFIADAENRNLYVFYYSLLHDRAEDELVVRGHHFTKKFDSLVRGEGVLSKNKLSIGGNYYYYFEDNPRWTSEKRYFSK